MNTGWDGLGNFAGEIKNPGKTYPIGVLIAIILNSISFIISVITAISVPILNDSHVWDVGYFAIAYNEIHPHWLQLGTWIAFVNIIGNFGLYVTAIASTSRALQTMASNVLSDSNIYNDRNGTKMRLIPQQFGYIWDRTHSPVMAVIFQSIIVGLLMTTTFDTLVQCSVTLNCITLIFEFSSFIRLRYSEPNTYRPFKIRGGICIAWLLTIVKILLVSIVIVFAMSQSIFTFWIVIVFNVAVVVLYVLDKKIGLPCGIGLSYAEAQHPLNSNRPNVYHKLDQQR